MSQVWAEGSWGCGAFLVALFLCIFLVGILIFVYLIVVKPAGTLTVTYVLQMPPTMVQSQPYEPTDLVGRLARLEAAHVAGVISPEEYTARRRAIIEST